MASVVAVHPSERGVASAQLEANLKCWHDKPWSYRQPVLSSNIPVINQTVEPAPFVSSVTNQTVPFVARVTNQTVEPAPFDAGVTNLSDRRARPLRHQCNQ